MRAIALQHRPSLQAVVATGAVIGVFTALALLLWAQYGAAAFYEQLAAGLGICF